MDYVVAYLLLITITLFPLVLMMVMLFSSSETKGINEPFALSNTVVVSSSSSHTKRRDRQLQHLTTYTYSTDPLMYIVYIKVLGGEGGVIVLDSKDWTVIDRFGKYSGTCAQVVNNHLYTAGPGNVYRYTINPDTGLVRNRDTPDLVVRGIKSNRIADSPIFVVDPSETQLYVHVQSLTNACQPPAFDRKSGTSGEMPCNRGMTESGVWLFDPMETNQTLDQGVRISSGVRRMRAMALDGRQRLYGIVQGRDSLHELYPHAFSEQDSKRLASDMLIEITRATDFGHPYCYFDVEAKKYKLNPEYGGDGINVAQCNVMTSKPIMGFDGHQGPNDLAFTPDGTSLLVAWNGWPVSVRCPGTSSAPLKQDGGDDITTTRASSAVDKDACANTSTRVSTLSMPLTGESIETTVIQFDPIDRVRPAGLCFAPDSTLLVTDSLGGRVFVFSPSSNR